MRAVLKNKVLVAIIAILLLTNIVMLVFLLGKKADKPGRKPSSSGVSYLQKELGFTEQQMAQFNAMKEEHREKINSLFDEVKKTKDTFFLHLKDSTASDSAVMSAANLIGDKQQALDMQVFESVREIRGICTSEQQQKFDSLLPKIVYKMVGQIRRGKPKEDSLKKKE